MNKNHPAYIYARNVADYKIAAPRYVRLQCMEFLHVANGKDLTYIISDSKLDLLERLLSLMKMAKGLSAGQSVKDTLAGFQWLFLVATLCTVYRDKPNKRRYQTSILEIARKNGKTILIAILFIYLIITEPKFSKFYSVAPDGSLSREVKSAMEEIIKSSPALNSKFKGKERFQLLRDSIKFNINENQYIPLNYSTSRLDGKLPTAFICDETGALPVAYPIEAMRSGQLTIENKLGCIISTKYPSINNPFEDEIAYAKKIISGIVHDDTVFALLYEPDNVKNWMEDDEILRHANPLAMTVPEIWVDLLLKRQTAIEVESKRENFLCKHCNIIYSGAGTETFIPVEDVIACRDSIDWSGRDVYLGVDLSMTNDNTAVAIVSYDEATDKILAEVICFIPEGRIDEKNRNEKLDYRKYIRSHKCISCGDRMIDYGSVEEFVLSIEEKYKVNVCGLGFDRYNCLSSAQKWEDGGIPCTEVRQHSSVLHPPTKWLVEMVIEGKFAYEQNELLEINFQNAKCTFDTNMNRYVNKKKSNGKIDMVVALINAVYMLQQNIQFGTPLDWAVQF